MHFSVAKNFNKFKQVASNLQSLFNVENPEKCAFPLAKILLTLSMLMFIHFQKLLMKPFILILSFLLYAGSIFAQEQAQDSTKKSNPYVITKLNGAEYIGDLISDDGREVLIVTENLGKIYIPKSDIKSMVKVEQKKDIVYGEYRTAGPFTTRYAFTNNAHPIKKGENYTMINLYGPEVHFAVSNHFNIGIMSTWIASPLILAMKYNLKTKDSKLNFSVGTLLGTSGYINSFRGYGGLHWLSMTLGDRMNNITFSSGYGYIQSGRINNIPLEGVYYTPNFDMTTGRKPITKGPLFSLAGILKVGAKASFVFDSMLLLYEKVTSNTKSEELSPGYNNGLVFIEPSYKYTITNDTRLNAGLLIMPGMRFQSSEKKAFQFSLAGVSIFGQNNVSFPFPMCSWFQKF